MTPTKTPAERQRAFRARKAESPEVRGIFAHPQPTKLQIGVMYGALPRPTAVARPASARIDLMP